MSSDLLQSLLSNVWSVFLVVLFFGGSIFVHELGHFLAARRRGAHVERFSIGFGPAIWSRRGKDGVEYRISWFPLGGYVLLPQLADLGAVEGESQADVTKLPPVSYATKMIVFVAGAAFNVLFAFALACIVWIIGQPESSESSTTRIGYVSRTIERSPGEKVPSPALKAGLRVGDTILAIDGTSVSKWQDIQNLLLLGSGRDANQQRTSAFTIQRDGQTLEILVHPELVGEEKERRVGIAPGYELLVSKIAPNTPAQQAGFAVGDEILRIGDTRVLNVASYQEALDATAAAPVAVMVRRNNQEVTLTLPAHPAVAKTPAKIGLELITGFRTAHVSPFIQIREQIVWAFRNLSSLLNWHSDVGASKLTGPVGILRIFHNAADVGFRAVLWFTILVNINLAIFNLLPLPVLDGGQMLFATIGRLRGRSLPLNFIMTAQSVFLALLFSMVLYVSFFDVRRIVRDVKADAAAPAKP